MDAYLLPGITLIASVISVLSFAVYLKDRRQRKRKIPVPYSWSNVASGVDHTINRLHSDEFVPEIVIGVGRSGAIYGALLAGNLGNLPFEVLDRSFAHDQGNRNAVFHQHIAQPWSFQRALLVIGEVNSGQSLKEALLWLRANLPPADIKTACMVRQVNSNYVPDYIAYEEDRAIVPPWVLRSGYQRYQKFSRSALIEQPVSLDQ